MQSRVKIWQKYYDTCSEMNDKIFQTARFDVPKFQYKEIIKDIRKKLNCVLIFPVRRKMY